MQKQYKIIHMQVLIKARNRTINHICLVSIILHLERKLYINKVTIFLNDQHSFSNIYTKTILVHTFASLFSLSFFICSLRSKYSNVCRYLLPYLRTLCRKITMLWRDINFVLTKQRICYVSDFFFFC